MGHISSRARPLTVLCVAPIVVLGFCLIVSARAGIRGRGKYCGVVVFDHWDTCFLLSGPYITYISGAVKDDLRPYKGIAMQVDALDVIQPMNPGDALIRKYKIIGLAPDVPHSVTTEGLEFVVRDDFGPNGTPAFVVEVRNAGKRLVAVAPREIGFTLLGLNHVNGFTASDGDSVAWITRANPMWPGAERESTVGDTKYSASYAIDPNTRLAADLQLEPNRSAQIRITFQVPPGHYEFMVGYGGGVHEGKSLASNAVIFEVSDGGLASLSR